MILNHFDRDLPELGQSRKERVLDGKTGAVLSCNPQRRQGAGSTKRWTHAPALRGITDLPLQFIEMVRENGMGGWEGNSVRR